MSETVLGKIAKVHFGIHESMFGLRIEFSMGSSGVMTSYTVWDPTTTPPSEFSKWNLEDQDKEIVLIARRLSKILNDAKVDDVYALQGKPVEVTLERNTLKDWRILTEVL